MRSRALSFAAVLLLLLSPGLVSAGTTSPTPNYTRESQPLGGGATLVYESINLEGTLLTDEIRSAADWKALVSAPESQANPVVAYATQYKTIGRRMTAFNGFGWVVIQYTIWQEFGYNGTAIVYYPSPTYDHQANWGWALNSHTESAWWVSSPTYRTSRGNYYFTWLNWSPFGDIGGVSSRSGWVQVYYHQDGSWTGTNS